MRQFLLHATYALLLTAAVGVGSLYALWRLLIVCERLADTHGLRLTGLGL